ncbi:MAG: DUF3147 family protein [Verrucomicrobiales bacterium]|nr:DUF3147 family protein [Verrucomicrobiales bacterium]
MTWQFLLKTFLSAAVIVAVTEVAKRNNSAAALIHALPWTSLLVLLWMHVEKAPPERIGEHCQLVFWYVIPTLPMFLAIGPVHRAWGFWPAMGAYVAGTFVLFQVTIRVGRLFGVSM